DGWQREEPVEWAVDDFLHEQPQRITVMVEGRTVQLRCWKYEVAGVSGFTVPVYFLDTDLPENAEWDRTLTDVLYGGDQRYRLCQEVVLGIGGVRMLRALGYNGIERFHMNEGHASLLTLELLDEKARAAGRRTFTHDDLDAVRRQCLFTTHTLAPVGHDQFPLDLVERVLGRRELLVDQQNVFCCEGVLDMTYLALNLSHYVNGVAKKHGEESSLRFTGYVIDSITNGVHAATWVAEPFQKLYDRYIPAWRQDNFDLRYALSIPKPQVWQAHLHAKRRLLQRVNSETNVGMDVDVLTLGFARRATTYKRADLLFADPERLRGIAATTGGLQVIYGGKAHPRDYGGKELIKRIFQAKELLKRDVKIVYLENYDMDLARLMSAGVDVWLNTPQPPLEASGTSGMKAALNGVPSFSVLDGWWIEGCIEGVTGWAIGEDEPGPAPGGERSKVVSSLYNKLERLIAPLFYRHRDQFLDVMLHAIALNGAFFNTHRMVLQYVLKAYL
ncbi:MAG TPA: alpha-glucan family phosphorylase, partial [Chthonomonadales bacterium]|nr:alpha-glucan family phosphorylase [Chthonomonadales bacterium]